GVDEARGGSGGGGGGQGRGIGEGNREGKTIEDITRRNADLFEQATGSAQSLERQAVRLTTAVSAFKLMA
ncbi:hypothetical protein Y5A_019475, partial [Burkholderia glumae AU6208]